MQDHACDRSDRPDRAAIAAVSADGATTVITHGDMLTLDGAPWRHAGDVAAAAVVQDAIWLVLREYGEHALHAFDRAGHRRSSVRLGALGPTVALEVLRRGASVGLVDGEHGVLVRQAGAGLHVEALGARGRHGRVLIGARALATRSDGGLVVEGGETRLQLPVDLVMGRVVAGADIGDGTAALLEVELAGRRTLVVFDARRGCIRARIRIGDAKVMAVAERAGHVLLGRGPHLTQLDVLAARCVGERVVASGIGAVAIDADAARIVLVDRSDEVHELGACLRDLRGAAELPPPEEERIVEVAPASAAAAEPPVLPAPAAAEPVDLSFASNLVALGEPPRALPPLALGEYLHDARNWVAALCRTAEQREADQRARARAAEAAACTQLARWNRRGAPHVELALELDLSDDAATILLLAAAPLVWGDIANAYARVAGSANQLHLDEALLAQLLEADAVRAAQLARALDADAPLIRSGALALRAGTRPRAAIGVHVAMLRRLTGVDAPSVHPSPPGVDLDAFFGPRTAIATLTRHLSVRGTAPARVVLLGGASSGRRTLAASLAALAGRAIGAIEIDDAALSERELEQALRDVSLRGDVPCVGIDRAPDDPALHARMRVALERHVGPVFVRAPRDAVIPLPPGYETIELAGLTESQRRECWQRELAARSLDTGLADRLAAAFAVGAGAIASTCRGMAEGDAGAGDKISTQLRHRRSSRIVSVARRVDRLAAWSELVTTDDVRDALREVVSRVRCRRTVLESWGLDRIAATARGVTALFEGGPGTGKTMAAGVIARELGYELWRIDLSRLVSKWIGETEKNLDAVFEAAEGAEVVLLFDEADSLFGKRTAVKSGHDRNANLQTNYLLQRLDEFTGVALLTTNFGSSIDPAFRRRLSIHLQFPFPDEQEREHLWRAHLPPSVPGVATLDFAAVARRHALSGGYIRNAALRAAFLAASESRAVTLDHLQRSIALEYQRSGKLGVGRLE